MAADIEKRVTDLEMEFKEYIAIFYRWLDETRQDMKEMRREHEERMRKLEANDAILLRWSQQLIEVQADTAKILRGMNGKLTDHEDRLTALGSAPAS